MIPASHLLIGVAVGRVARLVTTPPADVPKAWRDPLVAGAMAASIFPDWDVMPGLIGGYDWVEFHRGATHSPVGALLQALVMTPGGLAAWNGLRRLLPSLGLAPGPPRAVLFWVLAAGMGLHGLADALNPWGVAPLWPLNRIGQTWNLVHEGDQGFLVAAAVCAAVALLGGVRTTLLATVLSLGGFVGWKGLRREQARGLAGLKLGTPHVEVYPNPAFDCPWTAFTDEGGSLRAACVAPGHGTPFRLVREIVPLDSPLVQACRNHPDVENFFEKHAFPFAELEAGADGATVVLWRDLRQSLLEAPGDPRFGLAVQFDREGKIVSTEYRWMLKLAF